MTNELEPSLQSDKTEKEYRIGLGHDTHRFTDGTFICLGSVRIPWEKGLLGHSDADVLLHAITDAILGAAGLGDIGEHFPDTNPVNRNRNSSEMLQIAQMLARKRGWHLVNLDAIIFAERPKLSTYKAIIQERIGKILAFPPDQINIKAKTGEQIGIIGRQEAISAEVVVLMERLKSGR